MRIQFPRGLFFPAALLVAMLSGAAHAAAASVPTTTSLAVTSGGSTVTSVTSGSVVTLTACVLAGTTPVTVGQVNFCDATATYCEDIHIVGTAQLTSAGTATYKFRPGVGNHSYKAVFVGTPNGATAYAGSNSGAVALTVTGLWPSITTLVTSPTSSGNTYNLMATVGGNATTAPTGTVSFLDTGDGDSVLGTATLGAGTAGVSFLNTSNPGTGFGFQGIAEGDFNGDGISDLAVVNSCDGLTCNASDTGIVTVLLGNGDGTFTATPTSPATGNNPYAIAAADFNGDGILDLAVTNVLEPDGDGTVTILLGNGDGTFTPVAASPAVGSQPLSIAVGDFNGDGIPDLAVPAVDDNTVTVLLGIGDGTFTPTAVSPVTGSDPMPEPRSIAVGDFNGDGNLDMALANFGDGTVTVLLGDGTGNFTPAATSPEVGIYPISIAVGDFNSDGILDLAVASYNSYNPYMDPGEVAVLLGNGNGTFTPTATSPATGLVSYSIVAGDFNGDGIPDLAVTNQYSDNVTVLIGDGTGNFDPAAITPHAYYAQSAVKGDFNGDGVSDLAVISNVSYVTILEAATETATATDTVVLPSGTEIQQVALGYAGDSNYGASVLRNQALVTPLVTVTPASSSITAAQTLTVTVAVSDPSGSSPATGSVTLTSGSYTSAAATLSNRNVQINIPAGSLQIGSDTLTAHYTPDTSSSSIYASASGTGKVTVTLVAPTIKITPSLNFYTPSQALEVNVNVNAPAGIDPPPTGSVTLSGDSFISGAITLSGGEAQITIPSGSLSAGTVALTAVYTADSSSAKLYSSVSHTITITAAQPATLSPSSGTISTSQTFTWRGGVGPTEYRLWLGADGPATDNLYASGPTTATSVTVTIPSDGVTVYATLGQLINGDWQSTAYTFTEPGSTTPATLTPSSGMLLTSQNFSWSNGVGPADYRLWLGTEGPGTDDLYHSGPTTNTTVTVAIPSDGVKVYATLWQLINGVWQSTPYSFTEPGSTTPATLTPSSGMLSASQTFSWSNGAGPSEYRLWLGTEGPGTDNLYASGPITATTVTVTIPSDGVKVYATLWQLINGVWQGTPYTFAETGSPTLATLTPWSGLLSASQTFSWSNGAGPAEYRLMLGTTPGSNDLYGSGPTTETSLTVTIPSNGTTVYATLWQLISGVWHSTPYTFTEP